MRKMETNNRTRGTRVVNEDIITKSTLEEFETKSYFNLSEFDNDKNKINNLYEMSKIYIIYLNKYNI